MKLRTKVLIAGVGLLLTAALATALLAGGRDREPASETPVEAPEAEDVPEIAPEPAAPGAAEPVAALPQIALPAFIERFETLDQETRWYLPDRKADGDWQENDWRPKQVSLTDEGLALTLAAAEPGSASPFTSGGIAHHARFRYGYFEARLKAPRGPGLITGVFTYGKSGGVNTWNEIDIELLGRSPREVELTVHAGGKSRNRIVTLPFDAADGFHTYAFDWRPDAVRWYVDNRLVHEDTGDLVARLVHPQEFVMSIWGTDKLYQWTGRMEKAKAPWSVVLSCVAYAPAYDGRSLCAAPAR